MNRDFGRKVFHNTLFILSSRLFAMTISIVLMPYVLSKIGNDDFGIWVLVATFVSYTGLFDLGFGTSFVKYIAEYDARGDHEGVNGVVTSGLVFYLVIAPLIVGLAYMSSSTILKILNIPAGMQEKTRFVLELGVTAFLWNNLIGVYQSVISGLQRMDVSSGIMASLSLWNAIGSIVALELGFGIRGLAVNQLITQGMGTLVTVYCAYRLYPRLSFQLKAVRKYFSVLFRYGLNLQISNIAGLINFHLDKLLLSRFIDAAHVTFYEIGSRVPSTVRSFPVLLLSALTPATSELEVRSGRAELYQLFSRASKYLSMFAFPLFIGAMVTSQIIIEAWVGQGYTPSVMAMRILCIGYLSNIATGPVSPLVQGMGRPDYQRNAEALSLFLNLVLSVLLIRRYGFYGAPVGTTIAMLVASFYYLWSFHRFMERPLLPFFRSSFLKPALAAAVCGILGLVVISVLMPYASGSRFAALLTLCTVGGIFAACYFFLIMKSRHLDEQDVELLREHLPFLRWRTLIKPAPYRGRTR